MIKELLKEGNRKYFLAEGENGNIIFSVWQWEGDQPKATEEIETAFLTSNIPNYLKEKYTLKDLLEEPLAIFELSINKFSNELQPKNMSLWEYDTFIKNNKNAAKALKMAFINKLQDEDTFYIACESFDSDSMVTKKNMNVVNEYLFYNSKEIEKVLNKTFSHVEAY